MSPPPFAPLRAWANATELTLREIAEKAFGSKTCRVVDKIRRPPVEMAGCYLPFIGHDETVEIGFIASRSDGEALARAMLHARGRADVAITDENIEDTLREMANQFAGGIKRRMGAQMPQVELGLPYYVHGHSATTEYDATVMKVQIGPATGAVVILRPPKSPSPA